jgi:hypothetical protein
MSQSFTATPDQIASLRNQLYAEGVTLPDGNSGQITGDGITANFSYDGTTLTVTIIDKPWYIPASMIFDKIQSHLV